MKKKATLRSPRTTEPKRERCGCAWAAAARAGCWPWRGARAAERLPGGAVRDASVPAGAPDMAAGVTRAAGSGGSSGRPRRRRQVEPVEMDAWSAGVMVGQTRRAAPAGRHTSQSPTRRTRDGGRARRLFGLVLGGHVTGRHPGLCGTLAQRLGEAAALTSWTRTDGGSAARVLPGCCPDARMLRSDAAPPGAGRARARVWSCDLPPVAPATLRYTCTIRHPPARSPCSR